MTAKSTAETKKTTATGAAKKTTSKTATTKTASTSKKTSAKNTGTGKAAAKNTAKPKTAAKATAKKTAAKSTKPATKAKSESSVASAKKATSKATGTTTKSVASTKKASASTRAAVSKKTAAKSSAADSKKTATSKSASASKTKKATTEKTTAAKITATKKTTAKKESSKTSTTKTQKKVDTIPSEIDKVNASIRASKSKAAAEAENAEPKPPQKITPNNRKIASKGQTKEEQKAKKEAFNKTRAKWFDRYMKGTLPGLFDLRISTDRNVLLSDEEQIHLAEFIQAGIAGKVLLNKVEQEAGKEDPIHLQRTVEPDAEHILQCLAEEGYVPEQYIGNRRELRKLERLVSQSESARFVFAEKNLGLVTMIAGRRKKQSNAANAVEFDDLVAEGMGGLMVAIDHYNPDTGFKFSTPAAWWIEQPIRNYLDSKIYTIHMPTHMNNIYKSIEYAKNALREKFPDDSYITDEAIAEYCQSTGRDITVEKIQEARMYRRETISYDVPFSENDSNDKSISELLSSDEDISLSVLDQIGGRDNFNRMLALVDDDKKREILRDWYSSKDMHDIVILSNVSRKHCLTKERVRQLKQEGEKELFGKITKLAKEKGVSIGEAVMVDDTDEETFMLG